MYGIYANIWGILMVNVTIYGIHGSYGSCHHVPHEAMTICSLLVIPWEKPWNSWEIPAFFGPKHAPCLPWVSPSVSATKQAAGQLLVEISMAHDEPNGFNIINPPNPSISMDWWSKLTGNSRVLITFKGKLFIQKIPFFCTQIIPFNPKLVSVPGGNQTWLLDKSTIYFDDEFRMFGFSSQPCLMTLDGIPASQ